MNTATPESPASALDLEEFPLELNDAHRAHFEEEGYLAFANVLSPEELETARAGISELVQSCRGEDVERSGSFWHATSCKTHVQFESGYIPSPEDADLELKVRKVCAFIGDSDFMNFLATSHPRIQAVLELLIGKDPILFQDMALIKPAHIGSEKPWHQDNAYFSVEPLEAVCGIWIALDDATVENGCMHVLAGGHKQGAFKHFHDRDCEIALSKIDPERIRPVPVPAGGIMFFKGMLPHQTPPNFSPERRRAIQFHYRSQDSRKISREEYDVLYSETDPATGEQIPASCAANLPAR